jgi:hypothetical protein
MKCLTVRQPWASLTVLGATHYLVRAWRTFHRGPLAIQAARLFPQEQRLLCLDPLMRGLLQRHGYPYADDLPIQALVGTVTVVDCFIVNEDTRDCFDPEDPAVVFGLVQPGRWVWICAHPQAFVQAVPMAGRLGVYTIPDSVIPVQ